MTENALSIYTQFNQIQSAARALQASGYFSDVRSEAQAIVKVMAGAELGLPPFASMTGIHIIQGKPALGANVIATLIKNDPRYNYRVVEHTDKVCKIQFFENGQPCGVSEFTADDARKAGTKNMDKFPKNMLFARALSNGAKWYTPGVFGGAPVYTPDELGVEVDEDGVIIEGAYTQPEPTRQPAPAQPVKQHAQPATQPATVLAADEVAIMDGEASQFFDTVVALIDRYENVHAVKAAAKKLGYEGLSKVPAKRLEMYRAIRDHAAQRDAEGQAALFEDAENGAYQE